MKTLIQLLSDNPMTTFVAKTSSRLRLGRTILRGRRLVLLLSFLYAALLPRPCAATPGEWEYTGKLNMARSGGTSVLLLDGRAMVVGSGGVS